jgi:multidrug efflux pump subunit AcrA (membrane-fusion protein)
MIRPALLLLTLTAFGAHLACSHEPGPRPDAAPPIAVKTTRAAVVELRSVFDAGGSVRARNTATIVSRIVADVRAIRVAPGDRVRAGQILMVLDSRDLDANRARGEAVVAASEATASAVEAALKAAQASLTLATTTHQRIADLRQKNSATPHELDEAVAALHAADAQTSAARARVAEAQGALASARAAAEAARVAASYATLTAPFDGVVTEKLVELGNLAAPGVPLLRLEDTRGFRLEVRLDESRAALIAPGDAVDVELGGATETVPSGLAGGLAQKGRVSEVARALDPGSHAFLVKVDLPDHPGVRSGMYGRAQFAGSARRALAVPTASLVRRGQLVSVFVVDAGQRARLRLVNVAAASGDLIEVLAGLQAGEIVIVDPPPGLTDGARIAPERGVVSQQGAPRHQEREATTPDEVQGAPLS